MLKRIFIFLMLIFSLLGISAVALKAQTVPINVRIIGNKFVALPLTSVNTFNGGILTGVYYRISPIPQNSYVTIDIDNSQVGSSSHLFNAIQIACVIARDIPATNGIVTGQASIIPYTWTATSAFGGGTGTTNTVLTNANITVQAQQHVIISANTIPCTDLYIEFLGIVGTPNSDLISIYGTFTQNNLAAFPYNILNTIPVTLPPYTFGHIIGTIATALGAGGIRTIHTVNINTAAAGTFSIFDLAPGSCTGTPSTGTIAVITVPAATNGLPTFLYDIPTSAGLCVKASAVMDVTVGYN